MLRFREYVGPTRISNRRKGTRIRWQCTAAGVCYYFTEKQFNVMVRNYKRASCHITEKGLRRYCDEWEPVGPQT